MKNVLKKVSALLASATLLACGTAATTASALGSPTVPRNVPHNHGQYTEWVYDAGYWTTETYYTYKWVTKNGKRTKVRESHTKNVYIPVYHQYCKACCCRV